MAQQTTIRMIDDLDGTEDDVSNVEFGIDGKEYEIDLSAPNAERLRSAIAPFLASARRAGNRVAKATGAKMTVKGPRSVYGNNNAAIREWARSQGLAVSERGRISTTVLEAYANRVNVPTLNKGDDLDPGSTTPEKAATAAPVFSSAPDTTVQRKAPSGKTKAANPAPGTAATMPELIAFRESKGLPCGPDEMTKSGTLRAPIAKATRELMARG